MLITLEEILFHNNEHYKKEISLAMPPVVWKWYRYSCLRYKTMPTAGNAIDTRTLIENYIDTHALILL